MKGSSSQMLIRSCMRCSSRWTCETTRLKSRTFMLLWAVMSTTRAMMRMALHTTVEEESSTTLNQTIRQVPLGMLLKHLQLMHLVPSSTIRPLDLQEQREELPQRLTTAPDTTGQGIWPWLRPPNSCGPTEGRELEDGGRAHVMTDSR